jgi:uncharacterized membrane protein YhaH (DUF805 family)
MGAAARLFLSFEGRIARAPWWWGTLLACLAFAILYVFLERVAGRAATWVLYPPLIWALAALAVKRLHDADESPLWILVLAIPVLGPLWMFWKLGLRRGSPGENRHGPDPLDRDADYLVVQ